MITSKKVNIEGREHYIVYLHDDKFDAHVCTVPTDRKIEVEVWVHEFTESTIFDLISDELNFNWACKLIQCELNGIEVEQTIAHIVTSCVLTSMDPKGEIINADQFIKQISYGKVKKYAK